MRRGLLIALALAAGCKSKRKAAVVEPPADASIEDDAAPAEVEDLEDAIAAGAIVVTFEQETGPLLQGNVLHVDESVTVSKLVLENQDEDATIALPRYLFAKLPGYAYPYSPEGCLPEWPWLIAAPEEEVELAAGARMELRVEALWYLGNQLRPPPSGQGATTVLTVKAAPEVDRFARLADELKDEPASAPLAFAIAGGCTPEAELTRRALAGVRASAIAAAERGLRSAGFVVGAVPLFDAAREKRRVLVERMRADLATYRATHSLEGMQIIYASSDPEVAAFFAGDAELAEIAAGYLEPDAAGRRPAVAVFLLQQLGVSTPAVLDALDRTAADDADPDTRTQASAAAAKLRAVTAP